MDWKAEYESKVTELEELTADYEELGKTFGELQEELEEV